MLTGVSAQEASVPEVARRLRPPTVGVGACRGPWARLVPCPPVPRLHDFMSLLSGPTPRRPQPRTPSPTEAEACSGAHSWSARLGTSLDLTLPGCGGLIGGGADLAGGADFAGGGPGLASAPPPTLRLMSSSAPAAFLGGVGPAPPQGPCGPFCFGGPPPGRADGASCLLRDLGLSPHPGDTYWEPTLGPGPTQPRR